MKGSGVKDTFGTYGIKGMPDAGNTPGGRRDSAIWTDADGNFWLYGGFGYGSSQFGILSDLWKYEPSTNNWTWMNGSSATDQPAISGSQGVPAAGNTPGGRMQAKTWVDASGKLWLFGGNTQQSSSGTRDLWKYDPDTGLWTWINGEISPMGQYGTYGTQGVPDLNNWPGSRIPNFTWTDADGLFWMFGGFGAGESGFGNLSDLWNYNPDTGLWTWINGSKTPGQAAVYGTQGVGAPGNTPGGRYEVVSFLGADNSLWVFGGAYDGIWSDLWRFDRVANEWIWVDGPNTPNSVGSYLSQGVPGAGNRPANHYGSSSWTDDSGNFWFLGGSSRINPTSSNAIFMNDLWKYDPVASTWTWVRGSCKPTTDGMYGTKGIGQPNNTPGTRYFSTTWSDPAGNLWMFGGSYFNSGYFDDIWKYDVSTGYWIYEFYTGNYLPVQGTKGVPAVGNTPGQRTHAASWSDSDGNLWLFGGMNRKPQNDLWKYDISSGYWTWFGGGGDSPDINYGVLGVPSATNWPRRREGAVTWKDLQGNFWLFGGACWEGPSKVKLNDMWKLDPVTKIWTWVSGSNLAGQPGIYGTKGVEAAGNAPGSRVDTVSWVDKQGNLWLFGGNGYDESGVGLLNDLWKFNPATSKWTWVDGSKAAYSYGIYGARGSAAAGQIPGARMDASAWQDSSGNFWLFGGSGMGLSASGLLNDMWKFDPVAGNWTWIKGSTDPGVPGHYGSKGISATDNTPGARSRSNTWTDSTNHFWLYSSSTLKDLWMFSPDDSSGIAWDEAVLYE